ncbi:hypothetical protein [Azospirillum brasilense]|uniref:hypothetical protein n=1 Tax=Azospirillum brasilense TaxID=192 RepID=UPI000E69AB2C|nr:hypothetical protein [Azospirillum brasilense]NUB23331.1 hypothetical protein [Azospirillum brasilense]NUB30953.1 hypothetical protein [Azospirillum brasilense]RIW05664.1 hypothetical protein D2T81_07410 [Azospirillum brasilense]
MSYTETEFKRVVGGITKAIKLGAVESGAVWYYNDADGNATHVIFGRADIVRSPIGEVFVALRPFDDGISVHVRGEVVIGSGVVYTEINNAEREAVTAAGGGDIILGKLLVAADAAAPRLARIALTVIEEVV